jgi:metal-responsive CopG/Arc/MetJ family transcriptional regulator
MRSTIINLSLPAALLKLIDREARVELRTRSELLREAARSWLAREQKWKALQNYGAQQAKSLGIKREADVTELIRSVRRTNRSKS